MITAFNRGNKMTFMYRLRIITQVLFLSVAAYGKHVDIDNFLKSEIDRQWNLYLESLKRDMKTETIPSPFDRVIEEAKREYQFEKWEGKSCPIKGLISIPRELFLKHGLYLSEYHKYRRFWRSFNCSPNRSKDYVNIRLGIGENCGDAQLSLLGSCVSTSARIQWEMLPKEMGIGDIALIHEFRHENNEFISLKFARNNVYVDLRGEKPYILDLAYFIDTIIIKAPILNEKDRFNVPAFYLDKGVVLEFQRDSTLFNKRKLKFEPFLLSEEDMKGYKIKYPNNIYYNGDWVICEKKYSNDWLQDMVRQQWVAQDDPDKEIVCEYCVGHGAFLGGIMYHLKYGLSRDFTSGSFSGLQLGERSWVAGHHIAFVKANVGIIVTSVGFDSMNYDTVEAIARIMELKIDKGLNPYWSEMSEETKRHQIARARYEYFLSVVSNHELRMYTCLNWIDSKWTSGHDYIFRLGDMKYDEDKKILCRDYGQYADLIDAFDGKFELGIKSEWIDKEGIIVTIDICQPKYDRAENLAKYRAFQADAYYVGNPLGPQIPSRRWWQHTASVVFEMGSYAVHISQYNKANIQDIDTGLFRKLAKRLAKNI